MAKNSDIRLSAGWYRHPKIVKLRRRLGGSAIASLTQLWTYAGEERPSGRLTGMDVEDIEIAAGWDGEFGQFVAEMTDLRLLDLEAGIYSVHDWAENNPWASGADARRAKAKFAADVRHGNVKSCSEHAKSCYEHATSIVSNARSNAPSPLPVPVQPYDRTFTNGTGTKSETFRPPIPSESPITAPVTAPESPRARRRATDPPTAPPPTAKKPKSNPSPVLPDREYFRATESECSTARSTWLRHGYDESDFERAIAEVDLWLGSSTPKARAARASPCHTRHLFAAWVAENLCRRRKAARQHLGQAPPLTSHERRAQDLDRRIAEAEAEERARLLQ